MVILLAIITYLVIMTISVPIWMHFDTIHYAKDVTRGKAEDWGKPPREQFGFYLLVASLWPFGWLCFTIIQLNELVKDSKLFDHTKYISKFEKKALEDARDKQELEDLRRELEGVQDK